MQKWRIPVGETLSGTLFLTFRIFEGRKPGPTLGVISGVHGSEFSSIGGLKLFLDDLKKIPVDEFCGRVILLPFANPLALMQGSWELRMGVGGPGENLNRQFPGDPAGEMGKRLAHVITSFFTKTPPVDLFIDVHAMSFRSLPCVILDRWRGEKSLLDQTRKAAEEFGLGVVHEMPDEETEKVGLNRCSTVAMLERGVSAFTVEVPGGEFSRPESAELVRMGLWNMVRYLGILPKDRYLFWQDPSRMLVGVGVLGRLPGVRCSRAGFFEPSVEAGLWRKKGDIIGKIFDEALDWVEIIRSPAEGLVGTIEDVSIVSSGDELFELWVPEAK